MFENWLKGAYEFNTLTAIPSEPSSYDCGDEGLEMEIIDVYFKTEPCCVSLHLVGGIWTGITEELKRDWTIY